MPAHRPSQVLLPCWRRLLGSVPLCLLLALPSAADSAGAEGMSPAAGREIVLPGAPPASSPNPKPFRDARLRARTAADDANLAGTVPQSWLEGRVPMAPDAVTSLDHGLFGEQVSLFNGSLGFAQTDVQLPGNSALPVALSRRYEAGRPHGFFRQFGDWDLDIPRIHGVFSLTQGWTPQAGGGRCSNFAPPPMMMARVSTNFGETPWVYRSFAADEYWQGTHVSIPGRGSQEVLSRSLLVTVAPKDGNDYPLTTAAHWRIRCLPALQNDTGEGFEALLPDGTRYRFDWMVAWGSPPASKLGAALARREYVLYATEVTDRFGNWVRYRFDPSNPSLLSRIESSDGRVISIVNANGRAREASDGTRTWRYQYGDAYGSESLLTGIVQPDGSRWSFDLSGLTPTDMSDMGVSASCDFPGAVPGDEYVGTMTHPSGAVGRYVMRFGYHGRTHVERQCKFHPGSRIATYGAVYPNMWASQRLVEKSISGPGLPLLRWTYGFPTVRGWSTCTSCPETKRVRVEEPGGRKEYEFGIRWRVNEGQLLRTFEGWDAVTGTWLRTTTTRYRQPVGQAFPDEVGISYFRFSDWLSRRNRPVDSRITVQQGERFEWSVDPSPAGFDALARPVRITRSSSLGYSRTEDTRYHDDLRLWVLGQVAAVHEVGSGLQPERFEYDPQTAQRVQEHAFGQLRKGYVYYADGTVYAELNAGGRPVWLGDYRRGQPQYVTFADNSIERQVISDIGLPQSRTNAAGTTTTFLRDAMGRIAQVDHPGGDPVAYHPTVVRFEQVFADEFGIAAGHWRQTVRTGQAVTERYFDALLRERLRRTYDAADWQNTIRYVETRYDLDGRKSFVSYPSREFTLVDLPRAGTSTTYDTLGRVALESQDSELGALTTRTDYFGGFSKRVTNPRGHVSTMRFQAFDVPVETSLTSVSAPEGVNLVISRDVFGKATAITRWGFYYGRTVTATRSYVYDEHQRLCKTLEPETGATVVAYDAHNNVAWRASGLALPDLTRCDRDAVPDGRKAVFAYDLRERLVSTRYGDGSPGIERSYTPDGMLATLATPDLTWTYRYTNRRLLSAEWMSGPGQAPGQGWNFGWHFDANGNVAAMSDPWGWQYFYTNALGQPTRVNDYVFDVRYHPNGALAGFRYGNGVVHTLAQNARGLPAEWQDSGVTHDAFSFDANGNVTSIQDRQAGLNRTMGYDGLDRLTTANGPWGFSAYDYDPVDNLVGSSVGSRALVHHFDGNTNRLTALSGSQNLQLAYDANGNVVQRGAQSYVFDIANRLRTATGRASYLYDGHGRRPWIIRNDSTSRLSAYDLSGKLRFTWDSTKGHTRYVYLGQRLVAEQDDSAAVTYVHTDMLGSPVAKTNAARTVTERTRYEPYGGTVAGSTNPTAIGFTGHVNDADTGLVYMQQRYMDPISGRFLSVDPVTTDAITGGHFNRYTYADNKPYKYIDPDGRSPVHAGLKALDLAVSSIEIMSAFHTGGVGAGVRAFADALLSVPGARTGKAIMKSLDRIGETAKGPLPKVPTGPGTVPKAERDPQRLFTPAQREAKRAEQGGQCANGCGTRIDESNSAGHHIQRHADGGKTNSANHAEVCVDCHAKIHNSKPD